MMKLTTKISAAFLWDVNKCTISYIIIDNHFDILQKPKKYQLNPTNLVNFKVKVDKIIRAFYRCIYLAHKSNPLSNIIIEYKILHEVGHELQNYYEANEKSIYVKQIFMKYYALNKAKIMHMRLAKQLRVRLKRPALDIVKQSLKQLKFVKPNRQNAFEYHLWILALHATKSNYQSILNKMYSNDAQIARLKYTK